MLKMPENKTRKKLRITLCVLYLVEIVLCALPYFQYIDEKNVLHSYSVFDIMSVWGLSGSNDAFFKYSLFMPIFFIIPIAGFFFCALDKERNMKNIVSIICCLLGVLSIITMGKLYNQPCFCKCTSFVHSHLLSHNPINLCKIYRQRCYKSSC